jgi:hypothetical protein
VKERLFGELEEIISQNGFVVNYIQLSESTEEDESAVGEIEINLALSAIDYPGL